MRRLAVCLALCLLPLAQADGLDAHASLEPFQFTDAVGDTASRGEAVGTEVSPALDVLSAGVSEDADALAFWLELADLETISAHDGVPDYHVQYALTFTGDGTYSMRASYSGDDRRVLPAALHDGWTFQIHDHGADSWDLTSGEIDGDFIRWQAAPSAVGADDGIDLTHWGVSTWASYDDREQEGDDAAGVGGYILGDGAWYPRPLSPEGVDGAWTILDHLGDVTSRGDPYSGDDAANVDIHGVTVADIDGHLVAVLSLAGLEGIGDLDDAPGYHVQYAVSFMAPSGDAYSFRATYRGDDMGASGWAFSLHDQSADAWPDLAGELDGDQIIWYLPYHMIDVQAGDALTDWHANSWSSFDDREQRNDYATGDAYTVGSHAVAGAPGAVTSNEEPDTLEQAPGPGLALLALGLLVAARRR